jgi:hypothetical protein
VGEEIALRRSTLVAAAALALLGGYIYWFEREPVEPIDNAKGEVVFGVKEDSIDRIEIVRSSDAEPIVLEKLERAEENAWRLVSPVAAEADEGEVDLLLQNLATLRFDRVVARASTVALSDFGLESPRIEVRFRTNDGSERSLAFGSDTPTPSNQYARRDGGEDVIVVASHLSLNFDKSGWDLRDKAVFSFETAHEAPEAPKAHEVKSIEIDRPAGRLVLVNEGGLWFLTEPRSRADRDRAAGIVSRVRGAEMREIVSETSGDLEPYGLVEPSRRIRIDFEGEGAPALELEIGSSKESDHYARTPAREQVFVLATDLVGELDSAASELQSTKLFDYSTFAVKRFRIEAKGAETRELERLDSTEEKKWRQTAPEPARDLDTAAVEDFLYALNGTTGSLGSLAPLSGEWDGPDFTITVWSGEPLVEETLEVRKGAGRVEAKRAGESVVLDLTEEAWSDIENKMTLEPPANEAP